MRLCSLRSLLFLLIATGIILPIVVISQTSGTYWRNFKLTVPEEVSAKPGSEVTINGSILNTGKYWLRDFNITLVGLPSDYSYKVTPSHWDELRILRDWNPKDGVFRLPESFLITINVPASASGLYAVTVNGTEYASYYKVSNVTKFVLKISVPPKPELSNLTIPEVVYRGEPFDFSYKITNTGAGELLATAKLVVPENWTVDPSNRSITVKTNESMVVNFSVTSAANAGTLTAFVEYPYGNETFNVTKESLTIIPVERITPRVAPDILGLFAALQTYSPLLLTIIVVIILVIGWIVWSIYGMYWGKKRRAETKKQVEVPSVPEAF